MEKASQKIPDKYSAVWVSHSSMGDFLKCPRAYYLHNVYKDPKTRRKINIVSPALALGSAVHEAVEGLAMLPVEDRKEYFGNTRNKNGAEKSDGSRKLLERFETAWEKFPGKKGGFKTVSEEAEAKARGITMIERVAMHPGPLLEKTVRFGATKMADGGMLPHFFLSEAYNIILCGKVDWLVHRPVDDSIHILDFKTGKNEEKEDSLQLPIYLLLLDRLQKRKVSGASYWYLDRDDAPSEATLPTLTASLERVMKAAKEVKNARDAAKGKDADGIAEVFACPNGAAGCFFCKPFERVVRGEAEYIGVGEYNQDLFMV